MEYEDLLRFGVLFFELPCSTRTVGLDGTRLEVLCCLARMAGWNERVMYLASHIRPSLPTGTYIYI